MNHLTGLTLLKTVVSGHHLGTTTTIYKSIIDNFEVNIHDESSMYILGVVYSSFCSLKNIQTFSVNAQSQRLLRDLKKQIESHFLAILHSSRADQLFQFIFDTDLEECNFIVRGFINLIDFVIFNEKTADTLVKLIRVISDLKIKYPSRLSDYDEFLRTIFGSFRKFINLMSNNDSGIKILTAFAYFKVDFCEIINNEYKLITFYNFNDKNCTRL